MPTFWVRGGSQDHSVTVNDDEIIGGRSPSASLEVQDPRVSRAHFAIRTLADGWFIRDLGSANGTLVNGQRLAGETPLRDRDVIVVGDSSIVVGLPSDADASTLVEQIAPPPLLTPREQEALSVLCGPLLGADPYAEPASVREIAEALHITPDGVKKTLARLYSKFEIEQQGSTRRLLLARRAILSQAVRPA